MLRAWGVSEGLDRMRTAKVSWWCEFLALLLTAIYTAVVFHDLAQERSASRFSSPSWFQYGFCVYNPDKFLNSHTISFFGDLLFGCPLLYLNWVQYRRATNVDMRVAVAVSAFTMLHGFGHLLIDLFLPDDFMLNVRPSSQPLLHTAVHFFIAFGFFSMGPFLGCCNGVPQWVCFLLHVVGSFVFLEWVPMQFTFGFMQLYLNLWYCAPRLVYVGTTSEEDVAARVDDGWTVVSAGFLALMPVCFAEMLACESVVQSLGGHVFYDGSICLISALYSVALWRLAGSGCKVA